MTLWNVRRIVLAIEYFSGDRVRNSGDALISFERYQAVRNAIVRVCRRHAPTGPVGEYGVGDSGSEWEVGDEGYVYCVIDDQYNDEDKYLIIEVYSPKYLSEQWLADIVKALASTDGWGVVLRNLSDGLVLVFANKLMVAGEVFRSCDSVAMVLDAAREQLYS